MLQLFYVWILTFLWTGLGKVGFCFSFSFLYKNGQSLKQILAAENKKAAYESPRLGQGFPAIEKEGINGKAELDGEPKGN